jgi:hypothetical protein
MGERHALQGNGRDSFLPKEFKQLAELLDEKGIPERISLTVRFESGVHLRWYTKKA